MLFFCWIVRQSWGKFQTWSPSEPPFRGWTFCFVLFIRDLSIMNLGINFTIIINFNIFANSKCISLKFHKYIAFHFASELWIDIHCGFCIRLCRIIPRFENPYINSAPHCGEFIKNKTKNLRYSNISINKPNFPETTDTWLRVSEILVTRMKAHAHLKTCL